MGLFDPCSAAYQSLASADRASVDRATRVSVDHTTKKECMDTTASIVPAPTHYVQRNGGRSSSGKAASIDPAPTQPAQYVTPDIMSQPVSQQAQNVTPDITSQPVSPSSPHQRRVSLLSTSEFIVGACCISSKHTCRRWNGVGYGGCTRRR